MKVVFLIYLKKLNLTTWGQKKSFHNNTAIYSITLKIDKIKTTVNQYRVDLSMRFNYENVLLAVFCRSVKDIMRKRDNFLF